MYGNLNIRRGGRYLVPKPSSQNDSEVYCFKEMKFRAGRVQSRREVIRNILHFLLKVCSPPYCLLLDPHKWLRVKTNLKFYHFSHMIIHFPYITGCKDISKTFCSTYLPECSSTNTWNRTVMRIRCPKTCSYCGHHYHKQQKNDQKSSKSKTKRWEIYI